MAENFQIADKTFKPGESGLVEIPVGRLLTHEEVNLQAKVIHGKRPGPRLFINAAIHGDEINGVEIIRQLLSDKRLKRLRGTLILVPVVNLPGFLNRSRYLPDRRDLNRLFPGLEKGSMGARLARAFYQQIAKRCTHGVDLHTGAAARPNLPQIRVDSSTEGALEMARSFRPPVIIDSSLREGSLREKLSGEGIPVLVYEAGEALRLDTTAIRFGVRGIISLMRHLAMLAPPSKKIQQSRPVVCRASFWVRAPSGGIFRSMIPNGRAVTSKTQLGIVADPFGSKVTEVTPPEDGIVIGQSTQALVDEGDGLFHIAVTRDPDAAERTFLRMENRLREADEEVYHDDIHVTSSEPSASG